MTTANNRKRCFSCSRENNTYTCEGCSKRFCSIHIPEHHQRLNEELNHIIDDYNKFKQTINEQKQSPHDLSLVNQVNQWERNSIAKIQQKAKECREIVIKSSQTLLNDIEIKFNGLSEQIQRFQKENDFNENNLNHLRNQLRKMAKELNNPSNISIQQNSQTFISDISIISSKNLKFNKWKQNATTVAGGHGLGRKLNQVTDPEGIFIDKKKNILIVDYNNHRIVVWKCNAKEGQLIAGGNGQGNRMNQLNNPLDVIVDQQNHSIIIADFENSRVIQWLNQKQQILIQNIDCSGLAMDKNGFLYVSDCSNNEVRRWKMVEYNNEGILVAGRNGKGDQLNQLDCPTFIFVDDDQCVYISDQNNHRVMKWRKGAKEGIIVAGGNGKGGNLNQLCYPQGIIVDDLGQIYVGDCGNHRIMRWCEEKEKGEIIVGGNGQGNQLNQLDQPRGISFDDEGNLYVVDSFNHRIQKFVTVL
ncbi:unnamed protein product [Adineta steineri]|uniref:Uncharacterized protein n=1 Tax=Adineta steineri TaxID=433720 RepID=A0A814S0P7_9BILA|nr:unnamed protein product [Adineta steineri]CAF1137363.1 unnamed protein product [Adineta steineri]CAF1140543.1 unnamed protein product [Adineta steineri]